jgi:hypothetical protein
LNLTLGFAVAFFFEGAMLFPGLWDFDLLIVRVEIALAPPLGGA